MGIAETPETDDPPLLNRRTKAMKSIGNVSAVLSKWQGVVDEEAILAPGVDKGGILRRVAATISNPSTYRAASTAVFKKYAVIEAEDAAENSSGELAGKLPVTHLPQIMMHWRIPETEVPFFWALLRQEASCWGAQELPKAISFDDFQVVLVKFLRRMRDRYSGGGRISKGQFVTQNRSQLEERYEKLNACGKGSFGECFWVRHKVSKSERVCKSISKDATQVPGEEVAVELNTLKKLDHPNVVRVFEWFESDEAFVLVMEAARGGDLSGLLKRAMQGGSPGIEESTVQILLAQALRALVYIHVQRVIHCDIKPANMLLAEPEDKLGPPHLLLADFGIAEIFESQTESVNAEMHAIESSKGTLLYMAPEVFQHEVGPKSDVWSMGVVTYELLSGKKPFKGDNPMAIYASVCRSKTLDVQPLKDAECSEAAIAFITRLLVKKEPERPNAQEAMQDSWIKPRQAQIGSKKVDSLASADRKKITKLANTMGSFGKKSSLAKAMLTCVASHLGTGQLAKLNDVFSSLDINGDGFLSPQELSQGLVECGLPKDDAESIADSLDMDRSGRVDYSEFIASCLASQAKLMDDGALLHAFEAFDVDNDGKISLDELRAALSTDGSFAAILPDGQSLEDVIKLVDTSQDGMISFQEFKAYLHGDASIQKSLNKEEAKRQSLETSLLDHPSEASDRIEDVLRKLAPHLNRPEEEVVAFAHRLADQHWLLTVGDLRRVREEDWPRLQLPLKLECALRDALGT